MSDVENANLLTGTVVSDQSSAGPTTGNHTGLTGSSDPTFANITDGTTFRSRGITLAAGEKVAVICSITARNDGSGTETCAIYRDTTKLSDIDPVKGSMITVAVLDDPGAGTYTYSMESEGGTAQLQCSSIIFIVTSVTDTHKGRTTRIVG